VKRQPTQQELEAQLHSYFAGTPRLSAPPSLLGVLDELPSRPAGTVNKVRYPMGLRLAAAGLVAVAIVALVGFPLLMPKSPQTPRVGDSPSALVSASASFAQPVATTRPPASLSQASSQPATTDLGPSGIYIDYTPSMRADQSGTLTVSSPDTLQCTIVVHSGTQTFQTINAFNVPARTAQSVSFGVADSFTGTASLKLTCAHSSDSTRAKDVWDLPFTVTTGLPWSLQPSIADAHAADGYSFAYKSSVDAACTLLITYSAAAPSSAAPTSTATFQAREGVPGVVAKPIPGSAATGTATWQTTCVDGRGKSHVDSGTFNIL
jgi:hypothetical protein